MNEEKIYIVGIGGHTNHYGSISRGMQWSGISGASITNPVTSDSLYITGNSGSNSFKPGFNQATATDTTLDNVTL